MEVQWYPGHMAKARRHLRKTLPLVDVVLEIADARIPSSSRNPDFDSLLSRKPRVLLLARADLADPRLTRAWMEHYRRGGMAALAADLRKSGWQGPTVRLLRRVGGRPSGALRAMVVGIPNTGKSTAINGLSGRKGTRTGNRPGVTRGIQWLTGRHGLELLDTPGLLWPKLEREETRFALAVTGAIPDHLLDVLQVAQRLLEFLRARYPEAVRARYGLDPAAPEAADPSRALEWIGRVRATLAPGGEVDVERAAQVLIQDFRQGRLGGITLETPEDEAPANSTEITLPTEGKLQEVTLPYKQLQDNKQLQDKKPISPKSPEEDRGNGDHGFGA